MKWDGMGWNGMEPFHSIPPRPKNEHILDQQVRDPGVVALRVLPILVPSGRHRNPFGLLRPGQEHKSCQRGERMALIILAPDVLLWSAAR
jgi:hypothetical protein